MPLQDDLVASTHARGPRDAEWVRDQIRQIRDSYIHTDEQEWKALSSLHASCMLPMHASTWQRFARARLNLRLLETLKRIEQKRLPYFCRDDYLAKTKQERDAIRGWSA